MASKIQSSSDDGRLGKKSVYSSIALLKTEQVLNKPKKKFIKLAQITDLDIDASGQLFMSAWDGAGYSGNPEKGFVVRAVPKNWKYEAFPEVNKLSENELTELLKAKSATVRLSAQQELITRKAGKAATATWKIATDTNLSLDTRVAAIFYVCAN